MEKGDFKTEDFNLYHDIREGSRDAFNTLFLKYYPMLCSYASQYVTRENAEEIVQDTMLWFWENKDNCVIETSVSQYLFRSVRNRCLTLISRDKMRSRINEKLFNDQLNRFEDPQFYNIEELIVNFEKALEELPESYRIAFQMNRFEEKTYKTIAEELNISPKTVDYRIQQALKILRVKLKDYLPIVVLFL